MELLTEYQITEVAEFNQFCEEFERYDLSVLSEGEYYMLMDDAKTKFTNAIKSIKIKAQQKTTGIRKGLTATMEVLRAAMEKAKTADKKALIKNKMQAAKDGAKNKIQAIKDWAETAIQRLKDKLFDMQARGRQIGKQAKAAKAAAKKDKLLAKAAKKAGKVAKAVA